MDSVALIYESTEDESDFESNCDDSDSLPFSHNDITSKLAAAGPAGVAAAAAISTASKKRSNAVSFETNPTTRKRQQTRLLRRIKSIIKEYTVRVGEQVVFISVTPGKEPKNFKVLGTEPLEGVVRHFQGELTEELDSVLAQNAPQISKDPTLYDLPSLDVEGIPTSVDKMTQAQLRKFIPLMLKFSTRRSKPGWGRESTKPVWWPKGLPWANVRSDVRSEEEKHDISWTSALRQIVQNCYKYHGREDLLKHLQSPPPSPTIVIPTLAVESEDLAGPSNTLTSNTLTSNTLTIVHVEKDTSMVTLSDGTKAQLRAVCVRNPCGSSDNNNEAQSLGANYFLADLATVTEKFEREKEMETFLASLPKNENGNYIISLGDNTVDSDYAGNMGSQEYTATYCNESLTNVVIQAPADEEMISKYNQNCATECKMSIGKTNAALQFAADDKLIAKFDPKVRVMAKV